MSDKKIKFGLIGVGFIGAVHAKNLHEHPDVDFAIVADIAADKASAAAGRYGARACSVDEALASGVDALIIASSTQTHADLVEQAARRNIAVYCEKPIDLSLERAEKAAAAVRGSGIPFMIGFNRRYDASHAACKEAIRSGQIGKIEMIQMNGRSSAPPSIDYIKVSGGIMRDAVIHRFDLLRWLSDDEPVEVFAMGGVLVDPAIGAAGDIDTAVLSIRMASGSLCQIDSSRRSGYGYDERMEIYGSEGMVESARQAHRHMRLYKGKHIVHDGLYDSWFTRIADTYCTALDAFVSHLQGKDSEIVTLQDGIRAQMIAEAAVESLHSNKVARVAGI